MQFNEPNQVLPDQWLLFLLNWMHPFLLLFGDHPYLPLQHPFLFAL